MLLAVDRQIGRFAGFSLYVSNNDVTTIADIKDSTLCYKDGPQLPPLNFTRIYTVKGRYVIYYNERLDGVVYPKGYEVDNVYNELCEVIVQGNYPYIYISSITFLISSIPSKRCLIRVGDFESNITIY